MAKIAVLSELVQNRIAAGEVVERPASVVKELAENALDAGATRIEVELEQGGRRRIRVSDDGFGMAPEDLELALERFATSKLRSESDLSHVGTLGFRGEALPSMASVAELEIITRAAGAESGHRLSSEPGVERAPAQPESCSPGTIVELRGLFSRTPARLKFLKSDTRETSAVAEVVERLALSRPDVGWRLRADGKELLSVPAGQNIIERASSVFTKQAAKDLIEFAAGEKGFLSIDGLIMTPGAQGRRDRRWQHIFLNGRPIRDKVVGHASESAYDSLMPSGRRPYFVLRLEIDPAQVDVNVHPAKYEVRFQYSGAVHEFVRKSIREALRGAGADIAVVSKPMFSSAPSSSASAGSADVTPVRHIQRDLWGSESLAPESGVREAPAVYGSLSAAAPTRRDDGAATADARVIGRTSDGYVLMETAGELRIMDPHAIHERLLYESLSSAADGHPAESQSLLVPETVELTPSELGVFAKAKESLDTLGFEAELFGGRTVAVRAIPVGIAPSSSAEVLREVLNDIESGGSGSSASMLERVRKSIACQAAVKLGTRLDATEIAWLLRDAHDAPKTCPHGRPFAWIIPKSEIQRRLGRS